MTSLPPEAVGASGGSPQDVPGTTNGPDAVPQPAPLPGAPSRQDGGARPLHAQRPLPPVRSSNAAVELTLDLRSTPPDKVLSRLLGALERVSDDVVLFVLLRDTPEYVGVAASIYQALRSSGYFSDSSRHPQGGQRLRVQRRREAPRPVFQTTDATEAAYVPAPEPPREAAINGASGDPVESQG